MRLSFLALYHVTCDFSRAATFIEKTQASSSTPLHLKTYHDRQTK